MVPTNDPSFISGNGWDRDQKMVLQLLKDIREDIKDLRKQMDDIPAPGTGTICAFERDEMREIKLEIRGIKDVQGKRGLIAGVIGGMTSLLVAVIYSIWGRQ